MEFCYSSLATKSNLTTFGGSAISYIAKEIATHDSFLSHFASLFRDNRFNQDTIRTAFGYYVKVFANLRIKDLCRKYNSLLRKTTTAALRPSLATKSATKRKSKQIKKRERTLQKEAEQRDDEVHEEMLSIAETGLSLAEKDDEEHSTRST